MGRPSPDGISAGQMDLRAPQHPALTGVVSGLWCSEARARPGEAEWALPTGTAHIALRPGGVPIRIDHHAHGSAVLGGPRLGAYRRDTPARARSAGIVLCPWALAALTGHAARALRDRHVDLADVVGADAARIEEAFATGAPERGIGEVERLLAARVAARHLPDRGLIQAIRALQAGAAVAATASARGCSERHLRAQVSDATGFSPRELRRLGRLQRLLTLSQRQPSAPWAERALRCGYADQAHLCREFKALTGLRPSEYAPMAGASHDVPIPSETFKTRAGAGVRIVNPTGA